MCNNALAVTRTQNGNHTPRSALGSYHAGYPKERVHLDILGPINPRSRSGSTYILVMVDQFTKWVELAALPAQNAELTAKAFLKHFIKISGAPWRSIQIKAKISNLTCLLLFARSWKFPRRGKHHITHPVTVSAKFSTEQSCRWYELTCLEVFKDWD